MGPEHQQERGESVWEVSGRYSGLGLQWALSILLFLGGGWWLDGKIGTTPLFTILGAFLGGGAGFYSIYAHVVLEPRNREEKSE